MSGTEPMLSRWWLSHRHHGDREARERLIIQYLPLVKYVIGRMAIGAPGLLESDDILSHGIVGLIQAIDRYDIESKVKFETYAIQRIRGAIIDALRALDPAPRGAARRARELQEAAQRLIQRLGRSPSDAELAEELGVSPEKYERILLEASPATISLDRTIMDDGGEGVAPLDLLWDESEPPADEVVERRELMEHLIAALRELSERERMILALYYQEDLTLREISRTLGVTESRVSQIHTAALVKLRAALTARMAVVAP
ncbi:MAG TPA: FliA/WhiG family RNA polymerase sigma factor [Chloroflexota bacterium]